MTPFGQNTHLKVRVGALLFAAFMLHLNTTAVAEVLDRTGTFDGQRVDYLVVLPNGYDSASTYPTALVFPGGGQTMSIVEGGLSGIWRAQAEERGYVVIAPAAPNAGLFFRGGDRVFPEFLDKMLEDFNVEGGKFHVAGVSNGGLSSFHVASLHPDYFISVTGLPGYLPNQTEDRIAALAPLCLTMFVGERDTSWLNAMKRQSDDFTRRGMSISYTVEAGQGHVPRTLTGAGASRLYDVFDAARDGCG